MIFSRPSAGRYLLPAVLPLLLAGCAGINQPPANQTQMPAAIRTYQAAIGLNGRLSVHYQRNGEDEALHGSFAWDQTPEQTTLTLLSPLGQTMAIISATPTTATLAQSGHPVRKATDVDALAANALGWPLPISGLRDWLQGFAIDRNGQRFVATPRSTTVTTHDNWQIRYTNWADNRPKRLDLSRNTEQAGEVSLRIVIDTWQIR